jgi:hypothetical protein
MLTLLSFGLALLWASAALAKARAIEAFAEYLRPLFRSWSGFTAGAVVAVEVGLGIALAVWPRSAGPAMATIVVLCGATVVSAGLLVFSNTQPTCGCWGVSRISAKRVNGRLDSDSFPVIRVALVLALRNGLLIVAAFALLAGRRTPGIGELAGWFLIAPVIVGGAMCIGIAHERRLMRRDRHPRAARFEPLLAPLVALSWYEGRKSGR